MRQIYFQKYKSKIEKLDKYWRINCFKRPLACLKLSPSCDESLRSFWECLDWLIFAVLVKSLKIIKTIIKAVDKNFHKKNQQKAKQWVYRSDKSSNIGSFLIFEEIKDDKKANDLINSMRELISFFRTNHNFSNLLNPAQGEQMTNKWKQTSANYWLLK